MNFYPQAACAWNGHAAAAAAADDEISAALLPPPVVWRNDPYKAHVIAKRVRVYCRNGCGGSGAVRRVLNKVSAEAGVPIKWEKANVVGDTGDYLATGVTTELVDVSTALEHLFDAVRSQSILFVTPDVGSVLEACCCPWEVRVLQHFERCELVASFVQQADTALASGVIPWDWIARAGGNQPRGLFAVEKAAH